LPPPPAVDMRQALHTQLTKHCPRCNQLSPRQAQTCRYCGGRLP
jgi:ribosomal protein L40E